MDPDMQTGRAGRPDSKPKGSKARTHEPSGTSEHTARKVSSSAPSCSSDRRYGVVPRALCAHRFGGVAGRPGRPRRLTAVTAVHHDTAVHHPSESLSQVTDGDLGALQQHQIGALTRCHLTDFVGGAQ